jgi:Sec-independent protein translocase protein TatA
MILYFIALLFNRFTYCKIIVIIIIIIIIIARDSIPPYSRSISLSYCIFRGICSISLNSTYSEQQVQAAKASSTAAVL